MLTFDTFLQKYKGIYFTISNEDGEIIYPKTPEELAKFRKILSCPLDENSFYMYENSFYEYETQVMIEGQDLYIVESLLDVTKFENESIMAKTDVVTNLGGKRLTYQKFDTFISEAIALNRPFACAIGDADLFKRINDTYGHDCGDLMLRKLASLLFSNTRHRTLRGTHVLRGNDIVGRIGGEEFLIVINNVSLMSSYNIIDTIRRNIERNSIEYEGQHIPCCTMSFGIYYASADELSQLNKDGYDTETKRQEMIKKCDEALYISKQAGRNCVNIYGMPRAELDRQAEEQRRARARVLKRK